MYGSYSDGMKFKIQNFSHDETTVGQVVINTQIDYVKLFRKHRDDLLIKFCTTHNLDIKDKPKINAQLRKIYNIAPDLPLIFTNNLYQFIHFII